jgi:hypothetical protein
MIWVYAMGFAIIKYREGMMFIPGHGSKSFLFTQQCLLRITLVMLKSYPQTAPVVE